jgi:flagellar FliL protein
MATTTATQIDAENLEVDGEEDKASAAKRKFPLKLKFSLKHMAMAAGGLIALGGIGWGAYHFVFAEKSEPVAAANQIKPAVFIDMPEVLVNLSSTGGDRTQYLKVKVVLELSDQELAAQIQPVMPRLMDTFQTYLRELRPTDLDGSAGLYRLKEELTRRVNAAIAPSRINAVLFKEIVIQ